MVESLEQLSSASGKKKKPKKQQFNDGMVDAGDREAKKTSSCDNWLAGGRCVQCADFCLCVLHKELFGYDAGYRHMDGMNLNSTITLCLRLKANID